MYQASKRLQAIRRQLKQMDEQYRNAIDEFEPVTTAESQVCSEKRIDNAHKIDEARGSSVGYSTAMNVDSQEEQVSSSMNIGADLECFVDCSSSEVAGIPLSEELRCAISNMEDLDDVENLIGNMMSSVQVDTSYDEDLESVVEQTGSLVNASSTDIHHTSDPNNEVENPAQGNRMFSSIREEENWKKERKKKDNHNIIERRRRYNINDRIKELATLLPASIPHDLKQNKGSILKASVEYMKELMKDKHALKKLEENQKAMNLKYQKLLIKIFQLELKLKLYGLSEDLEHSRVKKKKKPQKRISEINTMVEDLVKQGMPELLEQTPNISIPPCKKTKNEGWLSNDDQKVIPSVKIGLRQHLNKRMSTGGQICQQTNDNMFYVKSTNAQHLQKQKKEKISAPSHSFDRSTDRADELHDSVSFEYILKKDSVNNSGGNDEEEILELSTEQCSILLDLFENNPSGKAPELNTDCLSNPDNASAREECISPLTSTCNMLESLLRKQDVVPECSSKSSGLEDSTESMTGLR
ncbi:uncharacterized protein LOC134235414 [Saccostrea cucullata]|uniref:uncharacterized protein LOC134235414 n=1 Tax=Saccostrea cuccullata TaxID=36930 RepID=UPI002ED4E05B